MNNKQKLDRISFIEKEITELEKDFKNITNTLIKKCVKKKISNLLREKIIITNSMVNL